jgi:L-threonylcarbamoyladenylate synthase
MPLVRLRGFEAIHHAAEIMKKGGVAFPTETVYGLGADALDPLAVARIFEIKNRPFFDPLIVHIADLDEMSRLVIDLSSDAGGFERGSNKSLCSHPAAGRLKPGSNLGRGCP